MSAIWECVWSTTVTTLLAWALAELLRRRSAAVRHVLWIGCLCTFLAVPALLPLARRAPAVPVTVRFPAAIGLATLPAPIVTTAGHPAGRPRRFGSAEWALAVWLAGVGFIALRRLSSVRRMSGIAQRSVPAVNVTGTVEVRISSEVRTPLTWGVLRPMIVLPQDALNWNSECLRSVLEHEREHIRRFDCLWHWLGEAICAVWWFHPFAWFARNRAAYERECACDDAVLRSGVRPSDYAAELLQLASTMPPSGDPAMALSAISSFERRIRTLLTPHLDRSAAGRRARVAVALATMVVIVPLAMLRAQAPAGKADLSGTVFDPSGGRVPNAQVIASGSAGNREITRANEAGEWVLSGIPTGSYTVEAIASGFRIANRKIELAIGERAKLDLPLELGTVHETVDVVSQGQARRAVSQASGTPERIRVGGNVQMTKLVKQTKPQYPESAKAQGIEGTVLLNAIIGKTGDLLSVKVINQLADPDLAAAALDAVKQWKFQPTLLNGEPVEVVTTITINFRLQT